MIDLHSHLLPGVDDGAANLKQAISMCQLAIADGCRAVVATPHLRHERFWNDDRGELVSLCRQLQQQIGDGLAIHLGGEIAVHSESIEEIHLLPAGSLLRLADSRYLLLEFPFQPYGQDPEETIYEIVIAGWRPIIAHPERIPWLSADPGLLAAMVDHGALSQVTAMSLTGGFGRRPQDAADGLLEQGLVHFVASDAHDDRLRPPGLAGAFRRVAGRWGRGVAENLFRRNPAAVLANRDLDPAPAVRARSEEASDRPQLARKWFSFG